MPKVPTESTQIRPGVISSEASFDLNSVEETLLVEVGYEPLHIEFNHVEVNENGSMLTIVLVSPQVVQIYSVQQILERDLHIQPS